MCAFHNLPVVYRHRLIIFTETSRCLRGPQRHTVAANQRPHFLWYLRLTRGKDLAKTYGIDSVMTFRYQLFTDTLCMGIARASIIRRSPVS